MFDAPPNQVMQRACGIFLAVLIMLPHAVLAQTPRPDAGNVLRETTQPPRTIPPTPDVAPMPAAPGAADRAAPGGTTFVLNGLRFRGNTVFSAEELQAIVSDSIGQSVTLAGLEAIAERIGNAYHEAGYLLAQAVVPVQQVTEGVVEIAIIEGALGKIRLEIDPAARVRPAVVERVIARLQPGRPLQATTLERVMLLLSDLPGIGAQAALEQGTEPGTSDIVISIRPRKWWSLSPDADNYGSQSSSEYRAGITGRLNGPLRIGDNLDARVQFGNDGRLGYDRVGYELPINGMGTRLGASYSRVDYELAEEFDSLDATGEAEVVEVSLAHPVIRSRSRNLFARVGWQDKELEDKIGVLSRTDDETVRNFFVDLAYEQRDELLGGGYTSAGLSTFFGDLDINSAQARAEDRIGLQTEGDFLRWNYRLSRLNALTGNFNLFLGITGQFADNNLNSAEKVSLGGPRGVRAYAPSEATVDEGHVVNLELRYSLSPDLSLQGFYDWGWGEFNRKPPQTSFDNDASLRGYGIGAFWSFAEDVVLRASVAWRDTERGEADTDRVPRVYMQVSTSF